MTYKPNDVLVWEGPDGGISKCLVFDVIKRKWKHISEVI